MALAISSLAMTTSSAHAQMAANPPAVAERVRQTGAVINPPETAKVYAPLHSEPTTDSPDLIRDVAYGTDRRVAIGFDERIPEHFKRNLRKSKGQ